MEVSETAELGQRIEERLRQRHFCVVPGCELPAQYAVAAGSPQCLGGRDWQAGDLIDLCHGHMKDIHMAIPHVNVADWILADHPQWGPDAEPS